MDTQIVEVRKNVMLTHQIQNFGETSFTRKIDNVNFIPDEVIVRLISFNTPDTINIRYDRVINIYTNLVADNWIGSITDVGSCSPNLTFTLRKPIFGDYSFQLFNAVGLPFNYIGDITIHLEFVKYRTDKPTKVY